MRVLIINYEFPPIGAGGGKASQKIAESLVEMGHTVRGCYLSSYAAL